MLHHWFEICNQSRHQKIKNMIRCLVLTFSVLVFSITAKGQEVDIPVLEEQLLQKQDTAHVNILNKLCWEYRRRDTGKGIEYGLVAVKISRELNYKEGLASAYKNLGVNYWIRAEYDRAEFYYDQALQLFKELDNQAETGNLHNLYGLLNWNRGYYPEAVADYRNALTIYREIGDEEGKATALGNLGIIYYETGRYDDALQYYLLALQVYLRLGDTDAVSNVYNNIGLIYGQQGNQPAALNYYRLSLRIDQTNKNFYGVANSFTNIGVCYDRMNLRDSSRANHQRAFELYGRLGDQKGMSHALINLGEIYFSKLDYAGADSCFGNALKMKTEIGDQLGEVIVLLHLGDLRGLQNRGEEAMDCFTKALGLSTEIGSLRYQAEAHRALSSSYENDNPVLALQHFKHASQLRDSLAAEATNTQLFNLQVGLETLQKEHEIRVLEKEAEVNAAEKRTLVIGFTLLGFLAISIVAYLVMKRRKERKLVLVEREKYELKKQALQLELLNREIELDFQRRELGSYIRQLVEKSRIIEELSKEFESLQPQNTHPDEDRIAQINHLAAARIITSDDWEEFKRRFTQVYPSFFMRLRERVAGITQAELRLSALIRLGLNNKEMSGVLAISADSVKKARQRLRKKMSMSGETADLENIISRF
jgi:tetratricopeptide (TPR) repeat protein/DNA-binding CsgD family transcriptional regulator